MVCLLLLGTFLLHYIACRLDVRSFGKLLTTTLPLGEFEAEGAEVLEFETEGVEVLGVAAGRKRARVQ